MNTEYLYESLTKPEILRVLAGVPYKIWLLLQQENVVLAGGCIRDAVAGLPVKDIDIFCHSPAEAARLAMKVSTFARHTTFAYSVEVDGVPVQFVYYKDFTDAKDLVSQFDFRACCAGIYYRETEAWEGVAVAGFRADCQARVLRFMSQKKDAQKLTALRRALDFAAKGWTISNDELTAIMTHWHPLVDREHVKRSLRPAYGRV